MGSIHDAAKEDDVSGVIVGGDYLVGILTYQGRQQGRQLYAANGGELFEKAFHLKREILADCGDAAHLIYETNEWQLKILS
jgi:chloramphenicol 3-O-phosphotransferase